MSKLYLSSFIVVDPRSKHHLKKRDLLISGGKIEKIAASIKPPKGYKEVSIPNGHVSLGWTDLLASFGDPGFEYKEDVLTGCNAAAAGGFTRVAVVPNTHPAIDSKSQVEYLISRSKSHAVDVMPIGAVTAGTEGKEITEMYDMREAGAVAFGDGFLPITDTGIMLRALQYVKSFKGVVFSFPEDTDLSRGGVMNEGHSSTELGLRGIPTVGEELMVLRDVYLVEYTDSRVHFPALSSAASVEIIKDARKKKLDVTGSVPSYHLLLDDSALAEFESEYKVNPPLRNKANRTALIRALKNGNVQAICSSHYPQDGDSKRVELEYAEYGMINLETCFSVARTATKGKVDIDTIVACLSTGPREILGLESKLEEGARADLTLFDPDIEWTFEKNNIKSRSSNTPFVGTSFTGKAMGIINNGKLVLS